MREAVIISTARTPIGKAYRGAFNNTQAQTLGGHVIAAAVARAGVDLAASVTGIAGPGGASADKPIGLIHLGIATKSDARSERHIFAGGRDAVRRAAMIRALELLVGEAR